MNTARTEKPSAAKSHGQRLSPELNEFLHMLTALEQQALTQASLPATTR